MGGCAGSPTFDRRKRRVPPQPRLLLSPTCCWGRWLHSDNSEARDRGLHNGGQRAKHLPRHAHAVSLGGRCQKQQKQQYSLTLFSVCVAGAGANACGQSMPWRACLPATLSIYRWLCYLTSAWLVPLLLLSSSCSQERGGGSSRMLRLFVRPRDYYSYVKQHVSVGSL